MFAREEEEEEEEKEETGTRGGGAGAVGALSLHTCPLLPLPCHPDTLTLVPGLRLARLLLQRKGTPTLPATLEQSRSLTAGPTQS